MSTIYYFSGKVKFVKIKELDMYDRWSLTLDMDPNDLPKFTQSGIQKGIKKDDNQNLVTFTRKPEYKVKKTGEVVKVEAPVVKDMNGNPTNRYVRNGDKVVVKVSVYDTIKGKGSGLESIMLTEKEGDWEPEEQDTDYDGIRF